MMPQSIRFVRPSTASTRRRRPREAVVDGFAQVFVRDWHHGDALRAGGVERAQMREQVRRGFDEIAGGRQVEHARGIRNICAKGKQRFPIPHITRIQPQLVPAAAAGLMIVMISACALHTSRGEYGSAASTFVLLLLAAFVAHGRWKRLPIMAKR